MYRRAAIAVLAVLLAAAAAGAALAWWNGRSGEAPAAEPAAAPVAQGDGPLALAGALELEPAGREAHADVAAHGMLAFVGKSGGACPEAGVDIIDISDPAAPHKVGETGHYENTSMEDVDVVRVGGRDVLAAGLQRCRGDRPGGRIGLDLWDVTEPSRPRHLAFFDVAAYSRDVGGVHELDVALTPSGRALALLAVPNLERRTAGSDGRGGTGDLLIVDITDPERPALLGEWGLMDEPSLGPRALQTEARGAQGAVFLHSARAGADGRRAYLSYWDAGVIILDISDPGAPRYLGRTPYGPEDEGNAHSVADGDGGRLLVQADEDFSPRRMTVAGPALPGPRTAQPADFGPAVDGELTGQAVFVGRGCPGDAYLADPAGRIALVERGECRFDVKAALAQEAGAVGVVIVNNVPDEGAPAPAGEGTVTLPDGRQVRVAVPVVGVDRETGLALRNAGPVAVSIAARFDGWGFLRFWDIRDPANPVALGTFATPASQDAALAGSGTWSVHNPEVRGGVVYASWYSDGVRAIDVTDPSRPREIGAWSGEGAPPGAGPVDIWGVALAGDLLVASDRNFGLYVFRLGG